MRIGYFGVIVPERYFWQGFFLADEAGEDAEAVIATMRHEFGASYMPPSAVIAATPGVSAESQPWAGALSAALVETALRGDHSSVAALGMALHVLTGFTHFIITGDKNPAGTHTTLRNLPAALNDDAVRGEIEADPHVIQSKVALMAQAQAATRRRQ